MKALSSPYRIVLGQSPPLDNFMGQLTPCLLYEYWLNRKIKISSSADTTTADSCLRFGTNMRKLKGRSEGRRQKQNPPIRLVI